MQNIYTYNNNLKDWNGSLELYLSISFQVVHEMWSGHENDTDGQADEPLLRFSAGNENTLQSHKYDVFWEFRLSKMNAIKSN